MSGSNYPFIVRLAEFAVLENMTGVSLNITKSEKGDVLIRFARVFQTHIVEFVDKKCVSAAVSTKISKLFSKCGTMLS